MSVLISSSGKQYTLGKELGSGGEGIVYEVIGDNSRVAKLYKNNKFKTAYDRDVMNRKLMTMINMNIPVYVDGILRLAWPLDILYENGLMVGFIMPKIIFQGKIHDIQRLESAVKKLYPKYTWKYSVQFAYNLSWVVRYLHDRDIIIGDLNPQNICIDTKTSAVILIDCDSFDIKNPATGEHFPCVVGLPEMLAPELQTVGQLTGGSFTKETDDFSLAIHIFRLLMKNADPFGGMITDNRSVSNIPANLAVINGECAYVKNIQGKEIPRWSPTLDMLPVNIQTLFIRTFNYDAVTVRSKIKVRATAGEWCDALAVLAAPEPNPNLKTCSANSLHVYPKHSSYCPWCRCENSGASVNASVQSNRNNASDKPIAGGGSNIPVPPASTSKAPNPIAPTPPSSASGSSSGYGWAAALLGVAAVIFLIIFVLKPFSKKSDASDPAGSSAATAEVGIVSDNNSDESGTQVEKSDNDDSDNNDSDSGVSAAAEGTDNSEQNTEEAAADEANTPDPNRDYLWDGIFTELLTRDKFDEIKETNNINYPGNRSTVQILINDLFVYNGYTFDSARSAEVREYYSQKGLYNPEVDYGGVIDRMKNTDYQYQNYRLLREIESTSPFYSIFSGPYATEEEAAEAISGHLSNYPVKASDWTNLEGDGYYSCLSNYDTEEDAREYLDEVTTNGHEVFVGYSGDFCGVYEYE